LMHPTKRRILDHLKRRGKGTIDELARDMALSRATVRQHLMALERDGLVTAREERGPSRRPRYVFYLGAAGHDAYPKRYGQLALLILEEVGKLEAQELEGLSAAQKRGLVLARALESMARTALISTQGMGLGQRVRLVTRILQEQGGLAEWRRVEDGYEIIDYNCVFQRVAERYQEVCQWHVQLLSRLLGCSVRCLEYQSQGANACRFVVQASSPGPQQEVST